jgi:phospholipid/cholesterol/gamma-HCH transport system substrate-binding protein
VRAVNTAAPTTNLLFKYDPVYTCLLVGAKWFLDNGGYEQYGGNGRSWVMDSAVLFGDDPYRYPENLPVIAAKGGPGGKPSCGSLPDATKNFPVRQLVTNTGWGTGTDIRPNPGIGHPWWVNFLPVTRAVPEPPSVRGEGPPAIGPVPHPGAPTYGAPLYGPDGAPLYPGVPPVAPAAPADSVPGGEQP